ncbi:MAG: hypothetical protein Q9162_003301 [Coniocarpon cinnabarinum]
MKPARQLRAAAGFPGFWRRSLDEFKRLSNIAIKLETLNKPQNNFPLWSFDSADSVEGCVDLSDHDIGGYSMAQLQHVAGSTQEPAHAKFTGSISNELPADEKQVERTGYAAFRTRERPSTLFGKALWDVEHYNYLALRIKSDGRKYKVNIQTESVEFTDLHQHRLYAHAPGEWETVLIKWADFVRTNHGIIVEPQSEMLREKVRTIGIGLTDRVAGPFDFRISRIWATNGLEGGVLEGTSSKDIDLAAGESTRQSPTAAQSPIATSSPSP